MTRDVSDITHWKHGLRFEKSQLVEIETWVRPDEFVCYGHNLSMMTFPSGNVIIERLCLSLPYVEKPFDSKVIKSFVPELRSCKCFLCFGIPMLYICMFHIFVSWICYNTNVLPHSICRVSYQPVFYVVV